MWKQIEAETAARAVPLTTICMAGILLAFRYDLWSEMIDTNAAYFQVPKSTFITVSFLCILGVMVTALVIWKSIEYYIDYHKAQADYKIVYERERNALIALYEALNGDEWVNKKNWCSDEPINTWKGVKLSPETRQVNKLILPENNLSGYIPEEIGQLVELREIDLRRNKIQGIVEFLLLYLH